MLKSIAFFLFFFFCKGLHAQNESLSKKLSVFIDCNGISCDENYIRTEINVVDFLSERAAADVHVLITTATTGGSTERYQLIFYGQHDFNTFLDTLHFTTAVNATQAETRTQLVHFIKLGLIPFLSKTAYASSFTVQMKHETSLSIAKPTRDGWNYVVFNLSAEGSIRADQNYTDQSSTGSISINRTTSKSRLQISLYGSKYVYTYKVEDSIGSHKYKVNNADYGAENYWVKAIGRHWGVGYHGFLSNNTFRNTEQKWYFNPVAEFNIFDYAEVSNRSFTLRYGADFTSYHYYDTTLYDKKSEKLYGHEISMNINFNQKWGSFNTGAYYRNYFVDPGLYSTGAKMSFYIRIVKGLSLYVSGSGNIVHDQVYIKKGKATEHDILVRKRELASSFDYYTSFGFNFRFGSKLNNFVNTRIGGYRGF